ncbi:MAG TPA: hypothetical protein VFI47_06650 [Acidimicrobiales bacterium]|nr:hypothetical protein [Acidimicrobiales bacterium]
MSTPDGDLALRTPDTPAEAGAGTGPPRPRRKLLIALGVAATVVLLAVLAAVVLDGGDDDTATTGTTASSVVPGSTDEPATTAQPGTTAARATAPPADQTDAAAALAPFFSAAGTLDGKLDAARAAIDATGPPWAPVPDDVAAAVAAAELGPVAEHIPAGLPDDLLQPVILVYSDLSSRRASMSSFAIAWTPDPGNDLPAELANGDEAAGRFADDLAAARSAAASAAPVTIAAAESRDTAEVMLLVQYVNSANAGCDGRGGVIVTDLPSIVWASDSGGTIGGIGFEATRDPGGGWEPHLLAC